MEWRNRFASYVWKYILRIKSAPEEAWINQASMWEPSECDDSFYEYFPHRSVGRPKLRWDVVVCNFCRLHFDETWQNLPIEVLHACSDDFIAYFCE